MLTSTDIVSDGFDQYQKSASNMSLEQERIVGKTGKQHTLTSFRNSREKWVSETSPEYWKI